MGVFFSRAALEAESGAAFAVLQSRARRFSWWDFRTHAVAMSLGARAYGREWLGVGRYLRLAVNGGRLWLLRPKQEHEGDN